MEDGLHADNRQISEKKDKSRVGEMAEAQTTLSRCNNVVGAVCKNDNRKEKNERNKDYKLMENHLYLCVYEILRSEIPEAAKRSALQICKAKIVRLYARRMEVMLDNNAEDTMDGE